MTDNRIQVAATLRVVPTTIDNYAKIETFATINDPSNKSELTEASFFKTHFALLNLIVLVSPPVRPLEPPQESIIGCVNLVPSGNDLTITDFYIKPKFRGKKYGKEAIRLLMERYAPMFPKGVMRYNALARSGPSLQSFLANGFKELNTYSKVELWT